MSEATTETQTAPTEPTDSQETPQAFTQADVDRIVTERLKRERDKIGDLKSLRAAADELAAIKESQKTEAQKTADRLAQAENEAASAKVESLRWRIAAKHQIGDEDAELFLTGSDQETLTRQAERLVQRESDRKKQGNHVPREGTNPAASTDPARDTVRGLFGG